MGLGPTGVVLKQQGPWTSCLGINLVGGARTIRADIKNLRAAVPRLSTPTRDLDAEHESPSTGKQSMVRAHHAP